MALFGKAKVADATVAEPEAPVIEVPPQELLVLVVAICPLFEDRRYEPGEKFSTTKARAMRLQELHLVKPLDASAPSSSRLADAKRAAGDAYNRLNSYTREIAQVERDLIAAQQRVSLVEAGVNQAENLEEVKTCQAGLSEALGNVEAVRRLLASAKSRRTQAENDKATTEINVRRIESRIAELTGGLIPAAERTIASQRKEIADLRKKADTLENDGIRHAEAEVGKLQDELKFLN